VGQGTLVPEGDRGGAHPLEKKKRVAIRRGGRSEKGEPRIRPKLKAWVGRFGKGSLGGRIASQKTPLGRF